MGFVVVPSGFACHLPFLQHFFGHCYVSARVFPLSSLRVAVFAFEKFGASTLSVFLIELCFFCVVRARRACSGWPLVVLAFFATCCFAQVGSHVGATFIFRARRACSG